MPQTTMARLCTQADEYAATFFLPVALLYAVTDGLYILGVHGPLRQQTSPVIIEQPVPTGVDALESWVESYLIQ
ncbi:MAG: hypothetical protein JSW27_01505, partial [Phycisphaerales bacterium]